MNSFRSAFAKLLSQSANKSTPSPHYEESMIDKIARFVACEMIEGDYVEFGVWRGHSFAKAYLAFRSQFNSRINLQIGGIRERAAKDERRRIWEKMRFVAVDSFQGLPKLEAEDVISSDFEKGQYSYSDNQFRINMQNAGLPETKVKVIKGWFKDVHKRKLLNKEGVEKAAVVVIDSDLYSSATAALDCATGLIQDGTVLIFDDWFSYKGNPRRGEQRAFQEWASTPSVSARFTFQEYQRETWKRMSFIASALN